MRPEAQLFVIILILYNNHGKYTRFASNPTEIVEARGGHVMVYNQKQDIYGNSVERIKT